MHTEFISHPTKIRMVTRQIADDIILIRSYLSTFITGKITPASIDPKHLRHELIKIHKQLPPKITLPENPKANIWHYYKFLTVTPVIDGNQLILMVRIQASGILIQIKTHLGLLLEVEQVLVSYCL